MDDRRSKKVPSQDDQAHANGDQKPERKSDDPRNTGELSSSEMQEQGVGEDEGPSE